MVTYRTHLRGEKANAGSVRRKFTLAASFSPSSPFPIWSILSRSSSPSTSLFGCHQVTDYSFSYCHCSGARFLQPQIHLAHFACLLASHVEHKAGTLHISDRLPSTLATQCPTCIIRKVLLRPHQRLMGKRWGRGEKENIHTRAALWKRAVEKGQGARATTDEKSRRKEEKKLNKKKGKEPHTHTYTPSSQQTHFRALQQI